MAKADNLYFVHLSIHGLIRGHDLELGRDADTGGQCKYVLELVRALARHPSVGQVDLITRQIVDPKVSKDYSRPEEELGRGAFIKRIEAGPRRYLRKEVLWRYMDIFVDRALAEFRKAGRLPDVIHGHYADAGYVGSRLAALLGCPFIFTGHSLGRSKRERLLMNKGTDPDRIETHYNLGARIEAEELALDAASLVCTSTQQEVEKQYSVYEFYAPERMRVIPPGVDVSRFAPPSERDIPEEVREKFERFLDDPDRPTVLAIARADEKKNLATLVKAFGQSKTLRHSANLLLVAGNRDTIQGLNPGARKVWTELLQLIDDYDLYGTVAIPKHHSPDDIPLFYRYAAEKKGVFVNPALTEPFGLTLIEAAASGLPILATNDGGPRDIIANCENGVLIDPNDVDALTKELEKALSNKKRWTGWSKSGLKGVQEHYTWDGHVERYIEELDPMLELFTQPHLITSKKRTALPLADRMIFCGLDDNLLDGDAEAIAELRKITERKNPQLGFGIASGRSFENVLATIEKHQLPQPDVYITQLGGEIYYSARKVSDESWEKHLRHRWEPEKIRDVMRKVPGLSLQKDEGRQHKFKISYNYDSKKAPERHEIQKLLRESHLPAKVLLSDDCFLDVIPQRSGKGHAIRYICMRWGIPAGKILFYARRGSDYEALSGQFLGVLGGDCGEELRPAQSLPRVYQASKPNFMGLLEGIQAYHFEEDSIRVPKSAAGMRPEDADEEEAVLGPDVVAHKDESEEDESE